MLAKVVLDKATDKRQLTDKQESFLRLFWDSGCQGTPKELAIEAGYSPAGTYAAIRGLEKEILELTKVYLVQHAPSAARQIVEVLTSDVPIKGVKDKLLAATTVLDRVGIVKKDKMEIEHTHQGGIFLIPTKAIIQPVNIENADYEEVVE